MTDTTRIARCGCGALTATARGEPAAVYGCSCLSCQRKSGSAFTYAAVFAEASAAIAGTHTVWRHNADSGRWIENLFCPTCGVTVAFRAESMPGMVGIPVGCFGDPDFAPPARLYWASRRHRWMPLPADIAAHETQDE